METKKEIIRFGFRENIFTGALVGFMVGFTIGVGDSALIIHEDPQELNNLIETQS